MRTVHEGYNSILHTTHTPYCATQNLALPAALGLNLLAGYLMGLTFDAFIARLQAAQVGKATRYAVNVPGCEQPALKS